MIKYEDYIEVLIFQPEKDEVENIKPGCSITILPGNTIKAAKFSFDPEALSDQFMATISFRLQPFVERYDTVHKYAQNGDTYVLGYDNDFYDGKVEYTANGYPS